MSLLSCFRGASDSSRREKQSLHKAPAKAKDPRALVVEQAKPLDASPSTPSADLDGHSVGESTHSARASLPRFSLQKPLPLASPSPSLPALPAPSLPGTAGVPTPAPTNASSTPTVPLPSPEPGLESKLLNATPWSTVVLTSDAKEVLLHRRGHEPAAALILDQALQLQTLIGPSSLPSAQAAHVPVGSHACQSFLHKLLGPDLEAEALATVKAGRPWRSNITKHIASGILMSTPGIVSSSAFARGPSAEPGFLPDGPRAHHSRSGGASCNGTAGAGQAGAGRNSVGSAVQIGPAGAGCDRGACVLDHHHASKEYCADGLACKDHQYPDSHLAATAGRDEPRGWLSSGGGCTVGVEADVKALVSEVSTSKGAAKARAAESPFTAPAGHLGGGTPVHLRPVSDPSSQLRDPIPNGMAAGRHADLEDCSLGLGRMRTSISACGHCFRGSSPDQDLQLKSSAAGTLCRSDSAGSETSGSFHTADSAWEDSDWEHRASGGPSTVREGESRDWTNGTLGFASEPPLDSHRSFECIAMDRQFSRDVGLVIGDMGEAWRDDEARHRVRAGPGISNPSSCLEMRSASKRGGKQRGHAEARGRSVERRGQEGRLSEAQSVPSANSFRSSNLPCSKNKPLRGSSSSRNLRQDHLHMSDRALEKLRDRNKTDESKSKTLALLTSISQAQVPAPTEGKHSHSLQSRNSQSTPSQISQNAYQQYPPSSPGGYSTDDQIISFANAAFHEPIPAAYTDLSDDLTFQPTCSASCDVPSSLSHAVQNLSNPQLLFDKGNSHAPSPSPFSAPSPTVRAPSPSPFSAPSPTVRAPAPEQRDSQHMYTPFTEGSLPEEDPREVGLEGAMPHKPQGSKPLVLDPAAPQPAASISPYGSLGELEDTVEMSFDIVVSSLEPPEAGHAHENSPLVVAVYNTTEHTQLLATLSALAESQLELLSSIMPQHAIQFLAMESTEAVPSNVAQLARKHTGITLLFMDIVGFTTFAKAVEPVEVMMLLNTLFSLFDELVDKYGVHKVETAGDCYIVSGGIVSVNQADGELGLVVEDHDCTESATRVMEFAKAMLEVSQQVNLPNTEEPVRVRVGMHTGDVVSGLIGSKLPKFSIFGDTMNTASRMESTGAPGRIHVSETTHRLLRHKERWQSTGGVEVKGKGQMQTYLWVPPSGRPTESQRVSPESHKSQRWSPPDRSSESLQALRLKHTCTVLENIRSQQLQPASCPLPLVKPRP